MDTCKMTDIEIYEHGVELLTDKLGPVGMMRFFWHGDPGKGVDRHKLPQPDIDTVVKETQPAQAVEQPLTKTGRIASRQASTEEMTDMAVYELGIEYLKAELGPTGFSRFLSQCKPLAGDSAVDRRKRPMPKVLI